MPMIPLELLRFTDVATTELLRQLDKSNDLAFGVGNCFWLGSVCADNQTELNGFMESIHLGDIFNLKQYTSMAEHLIYAVMVRSSSLESRFHIFVFSVNGLYNSVPDLLYAAVLPGDYNVTSVPEVILPNNLNPNPKSVFWKSFFEALLPFSKK